MGCSSSKAQADLPRLMTSRGDKTCKSARTASSGYSTPRDGESSAFANQVAGVDNIGQIRDTYSIEKATLGVGNSSTVSRARNKSTKQKCAVKTISKTKAKNLSGISEEIAIMRMLDHENIVKLIDTFEDRRTVHLVMELCTGGELSDRLIEVGKFTESQAAGSMLELFEAVAYLHSKSICHRDLKPENILFSSLEPIAKSSLKLIDFGSACLFQKGQFMRTKAGSSYFVAPQVLLGKYDHSSDLWSCGIIMHILLCGYPPFYGETEDEVLRKVRRGSFDFAPKDWKNVSEDAQIFIRKLTMMNPLDRCTAEQAIQEHWIGRLDYPDFDAPVDALDNVHRLRRYQSGRKLQKAGLTVISEQLTESQVTELGNIFMKLDSDSDGILNTKELRRGLKQVGLRELPKDFEAILEEVDVDSADSGVVDYKKFVAMTMNKKQMMQEMACWNAFNECGCDSNGNISREGLQQVLRSDSVKQAVGERVVLSASSKIESDDSAGMYSFEEFISVLKCPREKKSTLAEM
jgi:calcium-dependent protein kinase